MKSEPDVFVADDEEGIERVLRSGRERTAEDFDDIVDHSNGGGNSGGGVDYQSSDGATVTIAGRWPSYIYIGQADTLKWAASTRGCGQLIFVPVTPLSGATVEYGVATPPASPLRAKLNQIILKLKERGLLERLEQRWWSSADVHEDGVLKKCRPHQSSTEPSSEPSSGNGNGGMSFWERQTGAFVLLAVGILIAFTAAVAENFYNKMCAVGGANAADGVARASYKAATSGAAASGSTDGGENGMNSTQNVSNRNLTNKNRITNAR